MSEILSIIDVNDYGIQSMVAGGADLQEKTATPTTLQQVIQADEGYDGLSSVTVNAVTSAIDENIIPTNIRTGKTILGVQGNLEPDKPDQTKTVTPSTVQQVVVADIGYELARVTVEAVPDETPELNAQDTALSNQETVIGQLESALDNKIALDLADATSDATATAGDIAKNKTAYVNGVKLTGTMQEPSPDWSEIGYSKAPQDILDDFAYSKEIYDNWDSSIESLNSVYSDNLNLKYMPSIDTSNVTNFAFSFNGCENLITIPVLDTSKAMWFTYAFSSCSVLSNESLNNILAMCTNSVATSNKTLRNIGLSQTQATTCQTLSNWDAFVEAGWSTGY